MENNLQKDLNARKAMKAEDLLKKKDLLKARFNQSVLLEVGDLGLFKFRVPTRDDMKDALGFKLNGEDFENEMFIYTCCVEPSLKTEEIQALKEDKNDHPVEVVNQIFLEGEIGYIAKTLIEKAGFSDEAVKVIEDTKN